MMGEPSSVRYCTPSAIVFISMQLADIDIFNVGNEMGYPILMKLCASQDISGRMHQPDFNRPRISDVLIDSHDSSHDHFPCSSVHGWKYFLRLSFRSLSSRVAPRIILPGGCWNSTGFGICGFHYGGLGTGGIQWFGERNHSYGYASPRAHFTIMNEFSIPAWLNNTYPVWCGIILLIHFKT